MKGFRELALVISVLLLTCASSNAQEACCQRDSLASTPPQLNSEQSDNQKHSGLTIKTNLLGWMMLGANVAVEYDIIPHLSVALPFYYSGWDYGKETLKFRGLVLQPEVRFYIKDNDGFYGGLHFGVGWYNYALDGDYRVQDYRGRRPALGGGLSIGYAHHFKKNPRIGLEFSVGGGIYDVAYDMFYNEPNGAYAESGITGMFLGIDNASLSFTYRFPLKKEVRK